MPINDIELKRNNNDAERSQRKHSLHGPYACQATHVGRKAAPGNPIEFIWERAGLRLCLQLRASDGTRWH